MKPANTMSLPLRREVPTTAILLLSSIILLAFSLLGCGNAGASASPSRTTAPTPPPIKVTASTVESKVLPRRLEVTGALVADETADVAAERDGRVARVLVERGTFVDKGAVIALLDPREARATLDQATAQHAWAESEVRRYAELRRKEVVAKSERERKETERDLAKASLDMAQKGFEDTTIRAPFSGVITEKKISEGAFVRRGQAVAGLVKVDPLRAELAIPESAVSAVKVGQKVDLSVQTFPGRTFDGKIAYVGPSLKSEARTLVVEAVLGNPLARAQREAGSPAGAEGSRGNHDRLLKPGLFATASIELPASSPLVLAPSAAIVTQAGISRAFVLGADGVSERLVSLGDRYGDRVEVKGGLAAGDRVVLTPDRRLTDGLQIAR